MKNYLRIGKNLVCHLVLIVMCICIAIGYSIRREPSSTTINDDAYSFYLVAHESQTAQIWRVSPDNGSSSIVYEVAKSVDRPIGTVFPPEEIEKLQSYLAEQSTSSTTTARGLLSRPYIQSLALSPTAEALAWVEGDTYWVEGSAVGFGVQRLMTLNLNTGNSNILLQVPLHADEGLIYYNISDPTWSPDGQYVAVIRSIRGGPVEASLIVVNVSTGQTQEIKGTIDSAGPLVWAPDSATIAWSLSRWHARASGGAIRLCILRTEECRNVELDGLWIWGWGMDWAPDGKQIIFVAKQEDSDLFSDSARTGLYSFEPSTGLIQDVPIDVDGVLERPRWSPDGQLLAVDHRPKLGEFVQSLLVIEPTSGQIVSQLPIERVESSWAWGYDSHSILALIGTDRAQLEVGIFNIQDSSLRTIVLPDELVTKQISHLNW
jgi:dipeptidyl aminopeptidase/acylaminoacyl peptidase